MKNEDHMDEGKSQGGNLWRGGPKKGSEVRRDRITLSRIKKLHPLIVKDTLKMYDDITRALGAGVFCRFTQALRSYEEQNALYAIGRTVDKDKPKVTNAKGGESYHNFGLAFDIVLLPVGGNIKGLIWDIDRDFDLDGYPDWMEVVTIAKEYGWSWGGDWNKKDLPHFEKSYGYTVGDLNRMVKAGKVIEGKYPAIVIKAHGAQGQ